MNIEKLQEYTNRLEDIITRNPALDVLALSSFARILGVNPVTVYEWDKRKFLRVNRSEGARRGKIDPLDQLEHWKRVIGQGGFSKTAEPVTNEEKNGPTEDRLGEVESGAPVDVARRDQPPGSLPPLEALRSRGIAAAKEAFRTVILEAADEARTRGDHETRADLLEDYLFFEDGVELIYRGRPKAAVEGKSGKSEL